MKIIISLAFVLSFIVAGIDIAVITNSPRIGGDDLDCDFVDYNNPKFKLITYELYENLCEYRPHIRDPGLPLYQLIVQGTATLDTLISIGRLSFYSFSNNTLCTDGTSNSGFFNYSCKQHYSPSGIYFDTAYLGEDSLRFYPATYEVYPTITVSNYNYEGAPEFMWYTQLSWFMLADTIVGHSAVLFDDDNEKKNSGNDFQEALANQFEASLERSDFVSQVIPSRNIAPIPVLYMSYYPNYNELLVITHGISEQELKTAKLKVDGVALLIETKQPLIFGSDVIIGEGEHEVSLEYGTDLWSGKLRIRPSELFINDMLLSIDAQRVKVSLWADSSKDLSLIHI